MVGSNRSGFRRHPTFRGGADKSGAASLSGRLACGARQVAHLMEVELLATSAADRVPWLRLTIVTMDRPGCQLHVRRRSGELTRQQRSAGARLVWVALRR